MLSSRRTGRRLALTVLVVTVLVGAFVVRLIDFQIVRADALVAAAAEHRTVSVTTYGTRGSIVAADGTVLAQSVDRFDITAAPAQVDLDATDMKRDGQWVSVPTTEAVAELARITGEPAADILAALTADPESQFAYVAKAVTLEVYQDVRALDIPWVYFQLNPSRTYPLGAVGGNLVGFIGTDGPQAGVEVSLDDCLAGVNGSTTYASSLDGVRLPGTEQVEEPSRDGGTVHLTIDPDLQWYTQQVLDREARRLGADWATAMIVRVDTGELVTAADWPSVDPNNVDLVENNSWGARSFTSPIEPGSIMKPATVASVIDAGETSAVEKWTVPSSYSEGLPAGTTIRDAFWHPTMPWTTSGILVNSSNIGIAQISERLPADERREYLLGFGFNEKTEVNFLGESSGSVLPLDRLDAVSNRTQGFGQGIAVTSAQMASMYQALGNDGVRKPLTLVSGCEQADGSWTDRPSTEGERVVSAEAAQATVGILEQVVSNGPLTSAVSIPGYRVAAKTGTAEVAENGVYGEDRIISIAGLVPAENPQYAIVVSFVKPDTIKTSIGVAPAFADITRQVIKEFRIPPSSGTTPNYPQSW